MNEKWERNDPADPTGEYESFAALRGEAENQRMRQLRKETLTEWGMLPPGEDEAEESR